MQRFLAVVLSLLFIVGASGGEAPRPGEAEADPTPEPEAAIAPPFELRDQFKDSHEIAFPREQPLLLCFADPKGGEHVSPWYEAAVDRYEGKVTMLGVGLVSEFPRVMRPLVRVFLRKVASEVPIMLDWDGGICEQYAFEPEVPNILLISPDGEIVARVNSRYNEDDKTALFSKVDAIVDEKLVKNVQSQKEEH